MNTYTELAVSTDDESSRMMYRLAYAALEELAMLKNNMALFYAEEIVLRGDKGLIRKWHEVFK